MYTISLKRNTQPYRLIFFNSQKNILMMYKFMKIRSHSHSKIYISDKYFRKIDVPHKKWSCVIANESCKNILFLLFLIFSENERLGHKHDNFCLPSNPSWWWALLLICIWWMGWFHGLWCLLSRDTVFDAS